MKLKPIAITLLSAFLLGQTVQADEYATVIEGETYTIPAGKTALIVFATIQLNTLNAILTYQKQGGPAASFPLGTTGNVTDRNQPNSISPIPLTGPATPSVSDSNAANNVLLGLKLVNTTLSSSTGTSPAGTPSTAVVIPTDASGPVQIILESSTDLISWNAASPGSYGASTANRFFRVRAVQSTN